MAITPGSRIGHYEVLGPLGAGGMGEVWRARDTKLGREVALKLLPDAFAHDSERLVRFEREARLLASLNHPHIATLYGVENDGGRPSLVMELVEGESLAERLRRGPLPLDAAIEIAAQVAGALEAAHAAGVIHRDLKPGNVMLRPDGDVKVLDFGLARGPEGASRPSDLSQSPTLTSPTHVGVILGTAGYMSPEQAKGRSVDRRTDLWAWGCLLYECLAGRRAFDGEDVSDTLAAILKMEPHWDALPAGTPRRVRELIQRCLRKDPRERLRDAGDARLLLLEAAANEEALAAPPSARRRTAWPWLAMALAVLAAWAAGRWITPAPRTPERGPRRVEVALPDTLGLAGWGSPILAFAPDGRSIAYVAFGADRVPRAYLHDLETGEVKTVPGSETAEGPFFSPDGKWLAFAVGVSGAAITVPRELRKYSLGTGLTQTICPAKDYFGGFWEGDDIVWSDEVPGPLVHVGPGGGTPRPLVATHALPESATSLAWPQRLPGGPWILVTDWGKPEENSIAVFDRRTGAIRNLGIVGSFARYASGGYLLYTSLGGRTMAVRFDPKRAQIKGAPVAVLTGVSTTGNEAAAMAFSPQGHLAWASGLLRGSRYESMRLVRVAPNDSVHPLPVASDLYTVPLRISPDGHRAVIGSADGGPWMVDLERGLRTRLPLPRGPGSYTWMPDGRSLVFAQTGSPFRIGILDLASGAIRWIGRVSEEITVRAVTPDGGRVIIENAITSELRWVPTDGSGGIVPVHPGARRRQLALSPDGQWGAYINDPGGGRLEVFVTRMSGGTPVQISLAGGSNPRWSRDGRAVYFFARDHYFRVAFTPGDPPVVSSPEDLLEVADTYSYEVMAGRDELLAVQRLPNAGYVRRIHLDLHWTRDIENLMSGRGAAAPSR